jgi:hypothetical protein
VSRPPLPSPAAAPEPRQRRTVCCRGCPTCRSVSLERLDIQRLEIGKPVLGTAAAFAVRGDARLGDGTLRAALDLRRLDAEGHAALDLRCPRRRTGCTRRRRCAKGRTAWCRPCSSNPASRSRSTWTSTGRRRAPPSTSARPSAPISPSPWAARCAPPPTTGRRRRPRRHRAASPPCCRRTSPLWRATPRSRCARTSGADRRLAVDRLDLRVPGRDRFRRRAGRPVLRNVDAQVTLDVAEAERLRPLVPKRCAGPASPPRPGSAAPSPNRPSTSTCAPKRSPPASRKRTRCWGLRRA